MFDPTFPILVYWYRWSSF